MKIKLLKQIVFRDENGAIQAQYSIGDILEVSRFNGSYFVFSMGGIWADEAEIIG